jgi:hypothetical protein
LARAKSERKQYEAVSALSYKRNLLESSLDTEEAELVTDLDFVTNLESALKENLSTLGTNLNSLQIRLAKLG